MSDTIVTSSQSTVKSQKLWMPKRAIFTPDAMAEPFGQQIYERVSKYDIPVEILKNNRLTGLRGDTERETYKLSKSTLAVVTAPPSAFRLRPIPPSADYQFHVAEGCPAHCQYCYLAGSLQGPPVVRVFANLPSILENTNNYRSAKVSTTFEASCYTDPLSIEHLTGSLAAAIQFFADKEGKQLRFVTKFDAVDPLLSLEHNKRTRWRISLNARPVSQRLEGGTSSMDARLAALRKLALPRAQGGGGYPVGVVLAPIMPIPDWQEEYSKLLDDLQHQLNFNCDLTFELITHRFTPGSKDVLLSWYPNTSLDMDEAGRTKKHNKFGGIKYVYTPDMMNRMKAFFYSEIARRFPNAQVLYWT